MNKEKYSGCTVHYVNSRLDSGKIILQKRVKISKNETEKTLTRKIVRFWFRLRFRVGYHKSFTIFYVHIEY